jgi:CheY-like chemotaxis protein
MYFSLISQFKLLDMLATKKEDLGINLPNLIVLDLNMPLLNGFEVLEMLKNDHYFQKIPVVVLTSSSRMDDEKLCKSAGCLRYLKKPHSISGYDEIAKELLHIINSTLVPG